MTTAALRALSPVFLLLLFPSFLPASVRHSFFVFSPVCCVFPFPSCCECQRVIFLLALLSTVFFRLPAFEGVVVESGSSA